MRPAEPGSGRAQGGERSEHTEVRSMTPRSISRWTQPGSECSRGGQAVHLAGCSTAMDSWVTEKAQNDRQVAREMT
jgi:hypothetical protein